MILYVILSYFDWFSLDFIFVFELVIVIIEGWNILFNW